MNRIHINIFNVCAVFAVCSLFLSFSINQVKAQEALDVAVTYATTGAGGLDPKMTDKYDIPAQQADLRCINDDNLTNLNTDAGVINPLNVSKAQSPLYDNSDMATVLAEINAAPVAKPGLGATADCAAR